jgi:hypothetical protein
MPERGRFGAVCRLFGRRRAAGFGQALRELFVWDLRDEQWRTDRDMYESMVSLRSVVWL